MTVKAKEYLVICDNTTATIVASSERRAAEKFGQQYFNRPCVAVPTSFNGEDYFELQVESLAGTLFAKCVVTPMAEQGTLL